MEGRPKRRWYQFTLLRLFGFITLLAIVLGVFLICIAPAERQRRAARRIENTGSNIIHADAPEGQSWGIRQLRQWLPQDYFDPVVWVNYRGSDADMVVLHEFPKLRH